MRRIIAGAVLPVIAPTGDEIAFERLYRRWSKEVLRVARNVVQCEEDAEDVAQSIFMRLWRNGGWKRIERPADFFRRAAKNAAVSVLRNRASRGVLRQHVLDVEPQAWTVPDEQLIRAERRASVERLIEKLPPRCAESCRLVYLNGLPHTEVAKRSGVSRKAVEKQVARARRLLRGMPASRELFLSFLEETGGANPPG